MSDQKIYKFGCYQATFNFSAVNSSTKPRSQTEFAELLLMIQDSQCRRRQQNTLKPQAWARTWQPIRGHVNTCASTGNPTPLLTTPAQAKRTPQPSYLISSTTQPSFQTSIAQPHPVPQSPTFVITPIASITITNPRNAISWVFNFTKRKPHIQIVVA